MNKLTQEQVSKLDDFKLNILIAELIGFDVRGQSQTEDSKVWLYQESRYVDYCNNWNDLMPLVVEHALKIQTFKRRNKFLVRAILNDNTDSFTAGAKTLQRALAECLFLTLQEKVLREETSGITN